MPTRQENRKQRQVLRERFNLARKTEASYGRQLRQVAAMIDRIVKHAMPSFQTSADLVDQLSPLQKALEQYAQLLKPWASSVSARMMEQVSRRDYYAWARLGETIGRAIKQEIRYAPTGQALRGYLEEQVELITSLPLEAAERVHRLTLRGLSSGMRANEIASKILETGHVTKSRAMLIARTEVARTASAFTMVRAQHIGSEAYIWRTSLDEAVRSSHRKMEGKTVRWDSPPTLSDGTITHAGQIYNCRCWPEPILPDE
jgi:SPP1 gp7 family putative phage head morphogenesis protein